MNKFLIIGTGLDINNIDFSNISKDYIIAGVNRIYEKIVPDIFYCYDALDVIPGVPETVETIYTHPAKLKEFFVEKFNDKHHYITYHDTEYTPSYSYKGKSYDCSHGSINYLLRLINNYLYKGQENIFYLVGVPLLENVGHFYGKVENDTTTQAPLNRFYNDFLRLKRLNYNIVSLMKNSKLNELFPTEDINILYKDDNNG